MAKKPKKPPTDVTPVPKEVDDGIEESLRDATGEPTAQKKSKRQPPSYKKVGDSKIPVSKAHGKLWKARKKAALTDRKRCEEAWDEAIRYFLNDQMVHRDGGGDTTVGNRRGNQRLNDNLTETENMVFANITTMVPVLYSRNPRAEFTTDDTANQDVKEFATVVERLVNNLASKKSAPGLNLKPKAKRCVVTSLLTNRSWLQINWVSKEQGSEQALTDLSNISKKLEKAKDKKEIEELEGQLLALEDTIDVLEPSGPTVTYKGPKDVLIDPSADMVDGTDAKWLMVRDCFPTQYLKAKYGTKEQDSDQIKSVYAPTHVLKLSEDDEAGVDAEFSLFEEDSSYKDYGFDDKTTFEKSQYTEVWFVWDKTTRRVFLYSEKDWTWPLWVWDDPLSLDQFFPLYPLTFYESPAGVNTNGEVTYYLDQQDAINEMVDEERRARRWARRNILFDKNKVDREDVEVVLNGDDGTARGVDVPEGMKIDDVIFSMKPPGFNFKELFDKESKLRAIERISSVNEALRGAQFKTNTTNKAVEANVSASMVRNDEKTDQIEDWIGSVMWGIAQLCIQFMLQEQVAVFVGSEPAKKWKNMTAEEIRMTFSVQVVGGSSNKPTSAAKKEEAIQLGQVLGQFVQASPVVVEIMLRMLEQAFDEINIHEEDWKRIRESIAQTTQAQSAEGAAQGAPQGQPANGNGQGVDAKGLEQLLAKLPPEAKQRIVAAIQKGQDPKAAIAAEVQQLQ